MQPVAFLPGPRSALLVPQDTVDVAAALAAARDHGEITSARQARAVIRPHLTRYRQAGPSAGGLEAGR